MKTRRHHCVGVNWSDLLLHQMDKPWFRQHKEWQASAYKYILRREQIRAVETLVHTDQTWKDEASEVQRLSSEDVLQLAHNTSDSASLRKVLFDSEVLPHVRKSLKHVVKVMSKVSGTDSERHKFHAWFESLRVYHGTGVLFWTLNPRDTESALTIRYMADGLWKHEIIPLDADDLVVHQSFERIRARSPTALYDMITEDTVAACECFHLTVKMTSELLFLSPSNRYQF